MEPMTSRFALPPAALEWLSGRDRQVLTLGGTALPRALASMGHRVIAIDKDEAVVRRLDDLGITAVVAQAESLPLDPCQFDVVLCHQHFARLAPGLVLSEMARVLRPGGWAGLTFLVRDDSVPWVKRLIARVRELDPDAMKGDYGLESAQAMLDSKYFPEHDETSFRHWVRTDRDQLVALVDRLPAAQGLAETERAELRRDVAKLYDDAAPGADALRLPYQLKCFKGFVNHEELTAPIEIADDGLVIPL